MRKYGGYCSMFENLNSVPHSITGNKMETELQSPRPRLQNYGGLNEAIKKVNKQINHYKYLKFLRL